MPRNENQREEESRRILERVKRESEPVGGFAGRAARAVDDALTGDAAKSDDWAECWGTRIGRLLGYLFVLFLLGWLVAFLMRGG